MTRLRKLLHAAVGMAVAGLFLYLSLRNVDPHALWEQLRSVDRRFLLPILFLIGLFFWLKAIRWRYLLEPLRREKPLTVREVFPAQMIGFMGNNVLPAHLGEFLRMYVLGRQYEISKTAVLSTIVLERILDFLAIVGIFAVSIQFLPAADAASKAQMDLVRKGGYAIGVACVAIFLGLLFFVYRTGLALRWAERALSVLPGRIRAKATGKIRLAIEGFSSLRSPRVLAVMLGLTVVHWALNGVAHYLAAISFIPDQRLAPSAAFLLLSVTALGVTLPSAPGYVGTIQLCFVIALSAYGVPKEVALAGSIYATVVWWVPVTLVGLYFLARLGLRLGALSREAEAPEGEPAPAAARRDAEPAARGE